MSIVTENDPIPFVNLLIFDCIYRTTDVKQLPVPNPTVGISHPPVVYHAKKMPQYKPEFFLELGELLDGLVVAGQHTQNVETDLEYVLAFGFSRWVTRRGIRAGTYSLAQGTALANGNLVTLLNTESGGNMGGEVLVALLVTGVLGDEVKVLAADNESTVHLGGDDGAGEDTATDGDEASERALLVYCGS